MENETIQETNETHPLGCDCDKCLTRCASAISMRTLANYKEPEPMHPCEKCGKPSRNRVCTPCFDSMVNKFISTDYDWEDDSTKMPDDLNETT